MRVCALRHRAIPHRAHIEHSAGLSSTDRINPHKHSICCEKLLAHLVGELLVENRRLSVNVEHREFFEDPVIPIIL